jgi:hypothetical protein
MSWYAETRRLLPPDGRGTVDLLAKDFEDRWHNDNPPDIQSCLPANEPLRSCTLFELVRIDLEQRLQRGLPATAADYISRFVELNRDEGPQLGWASIMPAAA